LSQTFADSTHRHHVTDLGNYSRAIADYSRAIEIRPDYVEAHFNRALLYDNTGNDKLARDDYSRVIELNPFFVAAYINRGIIYSDEFNYAQAFDDFDKAKLLERPSYKHNGATPGYRWRLSGIEDTLALNSNPLCHSPSRASPQIWAISRRRWTISGRT
jgi:tetratricopeptide (TPR) repeat protein